MKHVSKQQLQAFIRKPKKEKKSTSNRSQHNGIMYALAAAVGNNFCKEMESKYFKHFDLLLTGIVTNKKKYKQG